MNEQNSVWNLIQELQSKKGITEIAINGPKNVFVERNGHFIQLAYQLTKNDLYQFIESVSELNKKPCDLDHPVLDGTLPDGSRINIIREPFAKFSPAITIRKYVKNVTSFSQSHEVFGLGEKWIEFIQAMVSARMNIVVSGGTGVGKTTLINLMIKEMSPQERVVCIEDTIELSIDLPNVVRLESGVSSQTETLLEPRDLLKNALRMRPDRIIIGEIRGGELFDLLQAMNTGHDGSLSSVHANSPVECLQRMETLFLLSGFDVPIRVVRKQMSTAVDFIIQLTKNREGKRIVSQITEITGMEADQILTQDIARLNQDEELRFQGNTPQCLEKIHHMGGIPMNFFAGMS